MSLGENVKKLLKTSSECQSKNKFSKSNCNNVNYKYRDENKLDFYTGLPTVAIFDLVFGFVGNSVNQLDTS